MPGPKRVREPESLPHSQGAWDPTLELTVGVVLGGQGGGRAWRQLPDLTQPPLITVVLTLLLLSLPKDLLHTRAAKNRAAWGHSANRRGGWPAQVKPRLEERGQPSTG